MAGQTGSPGRCGGDCLSASCGSWGSGGRYSCCRRGVHDRSPVCYAGACQVLFALVWLLIPGSNWSMAGCDRSWGSVGGYRVSLFDCCWSGHNLCCGCDACWGWRFACCPAAVPGVSSEQQRQVGSRSRGRRSRSFGEGADRRARERSRGGLLLLTALRIVGGGTVALPQIRLRLTVLTLLLPDPGMRLEVRVLVALPGLLTTRLVLGRRGLLQGMSLASLERVVDRLDPSGVADDDRSSTFAGFCLARGGLGGVSVAYGLFSSVGKFAGPPRLEVLGRILPPASGRSFIRAPQRGSCRLVDCCLACLRAGVGGLPCGGRLPRGY